MNEDKTKLTFKGKKDDSLKEMKRQLKKQLGWTNERIDEELKKSKKEPIKVSVSLKLQPEEAKKFEAYASLAIDKKVALGKTLKPVQAEIATFALLKLMKGEKDFLKKYEDGYRAKPDKERQAEEEKKKAEGKK